MLHYRLGGRRADARQLVQLLGVGGVQVHQERRLCFDPGLFEGHAVDDPGGGFGGAGGVVGAAGEDEDDEGAQHDLGPVAREEPRRYLARPRLAALAGLEIFHLHRGSPKPTEGSGAEGDRTPDLRAASAALSRLSYGPKSPQSIWAPDMGVNASEPGSGTLLLLLPVLLGGAAPEGFEAVVVAGLVGEHVDDYVEVV